MFDSPFDLFALLIAIVAFLFARKAFNQAATLRALREDGKTPDDVRAMLQSG